MSIVEQIIAEHSGENFSFYPFDLNEIIFEERVKLNCFHCKHYNHKHTCPPKVRAFDFEKVFGEYDNAIVVKITMTYFTEDEYDSVRSSPTNRLHKKLLELERILWDKNYPLAISFIGGSCKLCKDECDKERCRFPYKARIPWEATGANLVKTLNKSLRH